MAAPRHPAFARTIGIVGGLGPYAHIAFEQRLLELARAELPSAGDADFPPWVLVSLPHTPDRTAALLGQGPSPQAHLLDALVRLKAAGADFAVITCNTAHAFLPLIAGRVPLPVAHVARETLAALKARFPAVRRVGLLATTGTCRSGLFTDALAAAGIDVLTPAASAASGDPANRQEALVMTAIYGPLAPDGRRSGGIKGGQSGAGPGSPKALLAQAAGELIERGAELILTACSEIPLALAAADISVPLADTMDILAAAALDIARGRRAP